MGREVEFFFGKNESLMDRPSQTRFSQTRLAHIHAIFDFDLASWF